RVPRARRHISDFRGCGLSPLRSAARPRCPRRPRRRWSRSTAWGWRWGWLYNPSVGDEVVAVTTGLATLGGGESVVVVTYCPVAWGATLLAACPGPATPMFAEHRRQQPHGDYRASTDSR